MKRILAMACCWLLAFSLAACGTGGDNQENSPAPVPAASAERESSRQTASSTEASSAVAEPTEQQADSGRQVQITTGDGNKIVFQLNVSPAAKDFYRQLPLSIEVEDYAGREKIFYPPEGLDTGDTPAAQGPAGTLAYYAPWGNVAVFYGECGGGDGLYELGEAVSGSEWIEGLSGEIELEAAETPSSPSEPAEPENAPSHQAQPSSPESPASQEVESESSKEDTAMKMNVQIGTATFSATLEENAATASFMERMKAAPVVVQMSDYAGFEKVGSLGTGLPASNSQTTTQPGDIVLYNGNQIVLFYGSNSWSYTRLGKIDDLSGWEEALGSGAITATFSMG